MILPALSVKQPWATWIAMGDKTIETRTWLTPVRGPLVIVSSRQPDARLKAEATRLPLGKALCVVDLVACRPMVRDDERAARCRLYPGAKAWEFQGLWPLAPFDALGQLGVYDLIVPNEAFVLDEVREEIASRVAAVRGGTS